MGEVRRPRLERKPCRRDERTGEEAEHFPWFACGWEYSRRRRSALVPDQRGSRVGGVREQVRRLSTSLGLPVGGSTL